jgi:hypothetical protein
MPIVKREDKICGICGRKVEKLEKLVLVLRPIDTASERKTIDAGDDADGCQKCLDWLWKCVKRGLTPPSERKRPKRATTPTDATPPSAGITS